MSIDSIKIYIIIIIIIIGTMDCYFLDFFNLGHYMYLETSGWISQGDKAWLESTPVDMRGGKCLQFWYHMFGNSIGELNVYIKTGSSIPSTPAWSKTKDQGNQWFIGQVSVTNVFTRFSVSSLYFSMCLT